MHPSGRLPNSIPHAGRELVAKQTACVDLQQVLDHRPHASSEHLMRELAAVHRWRPLRSGSTILVYNLISSR